MIALRVLTIGTFDLLHAGHKNLISQACRFGSLLVGVNSDHFVETYKGRRPEQDERTRRLQVGREKGVVAVIANDGPGANLVRYFRPDLLVIGSDWHDRYLPQIGMTAEELFAELRCGVVYLPRTRGISTTELRTSRL